MTERQRPPWAARLQAEREARGWNKHEMARRLHKAAGHQHLPLTSLVRQILGWERGDHFPRDWRDAYATAFGLTEDEVFGPTDKKRLFAPGGAKVVQTESDKDEIDALELSRRVAVSDVSEETLVRLELTVDDLAVSYASTPPAELLLRLRLHLGYVGQLLDGKKTLSEHRRLLVAGGWLSLKSSADPDGSSTRIGLHRHWSHSGATSSEPPRHRHITNMCAT